MAGGSFRGRDVVYFLFREFFFLSIPTVKLFLGYSLTEEKQRMLAMQKEDCVMLEAH